MAELAELERQIGSPPGNPDFSIKNPKQKGLVQQWLIAQGLNQTRIMVAREGLLRQAYADPDYLRTLKTRRDYFPAAGQEAQRPPAERPAWKVQESKPVMPAPAANPAHALAAALQTLMPAGVSEDRVLQLIYEHVPAIVKLTLAEMFEGLASKLTEED